MTCPRTPLGQSPIIAPRARPACRQTVFMGSQIRVGQWFDKFMALPASLQTISLLNTSKKSTILAEERGVRPGTEQGEHGLHCA